jgi:hypothetical protein
MFQSTPPRKGRPLAPVAPAAIDCFNPRPRVRGDSGARKPLITKGFKCQSREPVDFCKIM